MHQHEIEFLSINIHQNLLKT